MLHVLRQQYPARLSQVCSPPRTRRSIASRCTRCGARCSRRRRAAGLPLHVVTLPWPCSNARIRTAHGRRGRTFARGGLHPCRVRRSVSRRRPALPRGAAGGHRTDAAVPAVEDQDNGGPRAGDDRRRPARASHLRGSAKARSARSPAARSTPRCLPICQRRSIRAASTASSTRLRSPARCSRDRSRSMSARWWIAMGSCSRICCRRSTVRAADAALRVRCLRQLQVRRFAPGSAVRPRGRTSHLHELLRRAECGNHSRRHIARCR